ncbi:MAG: preprotein translocase subunit SecE [Eubacteriales bacterium]|nr:preprotein translocase subunit SecE [Eubacteriales bacterium]
MANNAEKPNIFKRIGLFFCRMGKGIAKAFKNMFFELKKVTWPTKKEMINYCVVVFIFMVVMGVVIGLFDLGAGALVNLIVSF